MIAPLQPAARPFTSLVTWEARLKLVGLLCLIFAFASVRDLRVLPVMLIVACVIYRLSALPLAHLSARAKVPGAFLIVLAVTLPFFSGETVIAQLGPVALRLEGTMAFISVAARFVSIITVATVLFATTPMPTLVRAMSALGLPPLFGDMLLLTYRYIFQLADDLRRARTAARLRGANLGSVGSIKTSAYIIGSLLVRSTWQAERVVAAMTLRGYGASRARAPRHSPRALDFAGFAACVTVAGLLALSPSLLG